MRRASLNILVIGSSLYFPKDLKSSIERAHYRCEALYIQNLTDDIFNKLRDFEVVVLNVNTPEAEALFERIRQEFHDMYVIVYTLDKSIKDVETDFSTHDKVGVVDVAGADRKIKKIRELILDFWKRRISEAKNKK